MSAITELQRDIRDRADSAQAGRGTYRVTYSCGHTLLSIDAWHPTCPACHNGSWRVVVKP